MVSYQRRPVHVVFRRGGAGTFMITTMLRSCTPRVARAPVGLLLALTMLGGFTAVARAAVPRSAIVTITPVRSPRGVLVTSGGWPYCEQARPLARRARLALVCGGYAKDGYRGRKQGNVGERRQRVVVAN